MNHAMGSSFCHGSHTKLGSKFDGRGIDLFAFLVYQASLENLPNFANPIIKDLQSEPRYIKNKIICLRIHSKKHKIGHSLLWKQVPSSLK